MIGQLMAIGFGEAPDAAFDGGTICGVPEEIVFFMVGTFVVIGLAWLFSWLEWSVIDWATNLLSDYELRSSKLTETLIIAFGFMIAGAVLAVLTSENKVFFNIGQWFVWGVFFTVMVSRFRRWQGKFTNEWKYVAWVMVRTIPIFILINTMSIIVLKETARIGMSYW